MQRIYLFFFLVLSIPYAWAEECNTGFVPGDIAEHLTANRIPEAVKLAETMAKDDKNQRQALLLLAYVYVNAALRPAISLDTDKLGFLPGEGGSQQVTEDQLNVATGDTFNVDSAYAAKAEQIILQVIGQWPDTRSLYYCLTKIHFYSGDHQRFLQSLHNTAQALAQESDDTVDYLIGYAMEYVQRNQLDRAADVYTTLLRTFPKSAPLLSSLGVTYLHRGMTRKAMDFFMQAYQADPEDVLVIGNIAEASMLTTEFDQAERFLLLKLERQPANTQLYYDLAINAMHRGPQYALPFWQDYFKQNQQHPDEPRWVENARMIELAIEQGMNDETLFDLALQMIDFGLTKYAVAPLTLLKNKHPGDPRYTYRLAHAYDTGRHYDLALQALEETLERRKKNPNGLEADLNGLYFNQARYLFALGEYKKTLKLIKSIKADSETRADVEYLRALAHQQLGNNDQARNALQRCIEYSTQEGNRDTCRNQLLRL